MSQNAQKNTKLARIYGELNEDYTRIELFEEILMIYIQLFGTAEQGFFLLKIVSPHYENNIVFKGEFVHT